MFFLLLFFELGLLLSSFFVGFLFAGLRLNFSSLLANLFSALCFLTNSGSDLLLGCHQLTRTSRHWVARVSQRALSSLNLIRSGYIELHVGLLLQCFVSLHLDLLLYSQLLVELT